MWIKNYESEKMNWNHIVCVLGCIFQALPSTGSYPMKHMRRTPFESNGIDTEVFHPGLHPLTNKETKSLSRDFLLIVKTSQDTFRLHLRSTDGNHFLNEGQSAAALYNNNSCRQYNGKSLISDHIVAAISICGSDDHMSGIILNGNEAHIIRPWIWRSGGTGDANRTKASNDVVPHVIYRPGDVYKSFCGLNIDVGEQVSDHRKRRMRRAAESGRKIIETAVFVDYTLYRKMCSSGSEDAILSKIRNTVLAIVNEVQLIYNYHSLRTKFKIVIVKLEVLSKDKDAPDTADGDIDQYLDNFCSWQSLQNPPNNSKDHWDHALMLTGLNLHKTTSSGSRNEKVLGLAWVNGMCRPQHSCTLNEGSSFEAAFVIAHEMGHSLGMLHDGRGNDCDPNVFLMSEKTGPGKITWSSCSNEYLDKFFEKGYGSCLEDDNNPPQDILDHEGELPGHRFSLADQCKLSLGENFKPHIVPRQPFNDVCRELWCVSGLWASVAHPALEGSACGNQKYCQQGRCRETKSSSPLQSAQNEGTVDLKGTVIDFLDRLKYAFKLLAV